MALTPNTLYMSIFIIVFFLVLFFIGLWLYNKIKLRRLLKKYNETEDKSKQGEERARAGETRRDSGSRITNRIDRRTREGTQLSNKKLVPSRRSSLPDISKVDGDKQDSADVSRTAKRKKRDLKRKFG